ncbi:hypothetical protein ACQR1I_18065 [Bradyrhizobium sp. HKCCYLS2038]|uniref:hypothetical protein n=1 Tax=unclassified Bradyrhizobium TaxID=2631580 RepID=UPI003EBE643D
MSFLVMDSFIARSVGRTLMLRRELPERFVPFFASAVTTVWTQNKRWRDFSIHYD